MLHPAWYHTATAKGPICKFNVKTLAICTVSDHIITGEETTAEERQLTFNDMIKVGLETAIRA